MPLWRMNSSPYWVDDMSSIIARRAPVKVDGQEPEGVRLDNLFI